MKKFLIVLLIVLMAAVYLNIGWAYGTFFHHVSYHEPVTLIEKIVTVDGDLGGDNSLFTDQVFCSILWPGVFIFSVIAWLVKGLLWLLWLVFAGGIAKLLHLG